MPFKSTGLLAAIVAAAMMITPTASPGNPSLSTGDALGQAGRGVEQAVTATGSKLPARRHGTPPAPGARSNRGTATDPATQPPMHGDNPHGQGTVAVVDVNPSSERPLGARPDGTDSGEEAIVGRARGSREPDGTYRGHITVLTLLGQEIVGVDTAPGETKSGPLAPLQTGILDPLCTNTNEQVCLSLLTANSTTTATGSDNDFALARASVLGVGVGAGESHGTIGRDERCETASGSASAANASSSGGGSFAQVARSSSTSRSCAGESPASTNDSRVIGLGGAQVPLPAAGCADGTPDTVTGIPAVLPIVCNADETEGAAGVREALDVFALQVGSTSLVKQTTAASESLTVAPEVAPPPIRVCESQAGPRVGCGPPACPSPSRSDCDRRPAGRTISSDLPGGDRFAGTSSAGDRGSSASANGESLPTTGSDLGALAMAALLMLAAGTLMRLRWQ
jgi:hypothetical protein